MANTPNLNLVKPASTDNYTIDVPNGNMDIIDAAVKALQDGTTAAQVLAKILSVDGAGSGLDADKLDGQEGSYYRNADQVDGFHIRNTNGFFEYSTDGVTWSRWIVGNSQTFTSNGNFVVPAGVTKIYVTATAAGNQGSSGANGGLANQPGGKGGDGGRGGQGVIDYPITVTPGESIAITVGTGNTVIKGLTLVKGAGLIGESGVAGTTGTTPGGNGGPGGPGGGSVFGMPGGPGGLGGAGCPGGVGSSGSPGTTPAQPVPYGQGGGGGGGGGARASTWPDQPAGNGAPGALGAPGCVIVRW